MSTRHKEKKDEEKLNRLIEKKRDTQDRMYSLRCDPSIEHSDKEMDLKKFADDITALETKIIEQLKNSTDAFVTVLNLESIGMSNLFEERKKQKSRMTKLYLSPSSSRAAGEEVMKSPSSRSDAEFMKSPSGRVMSPRETGLFKSPSGRTNEGLFTSPSGRASHRGGHSGLNSLVKLISDLFVTEEQQPKEFAATSNSDLNALEQEIAYLRASIYSLEQKKKITQNNNNVH